MGGLLPWKAVATSGPTSERERSYPIDDFGWAGGRTLSYNYSMPQNHFMQLATNLSPRNGQAFVQGRRVHHTNMLDGSHDESPTNGIFDELVGLGGPHGMTPATPATCNGHVVGVGENLDAWLLKVGSADGPDPSIGSVLQPSAVSGDGEGQVVIASWEEADGLRTPVFAFGGGAHATSRIAPQLRHGLARGHPGRDSARLGRSR